MADNLGLDIDEVVILKEENVAHGGRTAQNTDELILTNKKIILLSKGMFGGVKRIYHYPLNQIKVFNGVPQVKQGNTTMGISSLDVYMFSSDESFTFYLGRASAIKTWVSEIQKLFGTSQGNSYCSVPYLDNNPVRDAFRGVGEGLKDIGKDVASSFGFGAKNNDSTSNTVNRTPNQNISPINQAYYSELKCPSCGKALSIGDNYCTFCGSPVVQKTDKQQMSNVFICPECGKRLNPGLKFCTECGTKIIAPVDVNPDFTET